MHLQRFAAHFDLVSTGLGSVLVSQGDSTLKRYEPCHAKAGLMMCTVVIPHGKKNWPTALPSHLLV